jgi:hypothetical protein
MSFPRPACRPAAWALLAVLGCLALVPQARALNMLYDTSPPSTSPQKNPWENIPRIDTPPPSTPPPGGGGGETPPPGEQLPEPTTLLSGLVGGSLFGLFGWWARRRPEVVGPVRLARKGREEGTDA